MRKGFVQSLTSQKCSLNPDYQAGDEAIRRRGPNAEAFNNPADEDCPQVHLSPANIWSNTTPSGQKRRQH